MSPMDHGQVENLSQELFIVIGEQLRTYNKCDRIEISLLLLSEQSAEFIVSEGGLF